MKKYFLAIIAVNFVLVSHAQRIEKPIKQRKVKEYVYPPNVLKLNLTGLLFKAIGIQYERKIANNTSLAIGITFRPKSDYLLSQAIGDNPGANGFSLETGYMFSTTQYSRFAFTPELKYYFKKKAPKGLYLAPFLKYQREAYSFNFKYTESKNSPSVNKTGSGVMADNRFGVGLLFGYQMVKTNKLAIDFWFLGPWFGQNNSTLKAKINQTNISQADKSILESNLEPFYNNAVIWDNNGINSSFKKYALGLRMIGVNIGYNF